MRKRAPALHHDFVRLCEDKRDGGIRLEKGQERGGWVGVEHGDAQDRRLSVPRTLSTHGTPIRQLSFHLLPTPPTDSCRPSLTCLSPWCSRLTSLLMWHLSMKADSFSSLSSPLASHFTLAGRTPGGGGGGKGGERDGGKGGGKRWREGGTACFSKQSPLHTTKCALRPPSRGITHCVKRRQESDYLQVEGNT